jgi:uncharacterized protein YdaU (DUF1376 family)
METMTGQLPDPFTNDDDQIGNYDSFMLNVDRLMASELMALSTGDEFKAAVALWCRAWKQRPAGSLPDDDRVLAAFSGAGAKWPKVKVMALRGFVRCSDGRLYHEVLCEDVRRAAEQKRKRVERTKAATEARKNQRHDNRNVERNDQRNVERDDAATLNVTKSHSRAGQGRAEEERKSSDPNGSDAGASKPLSDQEVLWRDGLAYLAGRTGKPPDTFRGILGKWASKHGARRVLDAIAFAQAKEAIDPVPFITACLSDRKREDETFELRPQGVGP